MEPTDEVVAVRYIAYAHRLVREEGIISGISTNVALAAAIKIAQRVENQGKLGVTIQPSFGECYLSTPLFQDLEQRTPDFFA
ncbi:hypothetical protein IQ249_24115 [Lusitaniella coriacea LEGE 07157]|uniref:Cysteine synthase n=1 Tax=Lusitaniella coriacea LEGE 07157 TaxID=945747 RepID=A0A8J7JFS8_9CYAN|nr:hypothetical protein [Lusitaniella coriacea]MBE9118980.1 hypothetical protein [Lusitaniella coriacea LEGE 07157]